MLLRLLIVLTLLGPSGPRVCTCAAVKASDPQHTTAPASDPPAVKTVCPCCRAALTPTVPADDTERHATTHSDHTAPTGHNPECPAAKKPAPDALAPAPEVNDVPIDTVACVSSVAPVAYEAKPTAAFQAGRARSPSDPQFCTVHVMRN